MLEEQINILQNELMELLNERDQMVEYANYAFEDYFKNKKPEVLENAVEWLIDHSERFDEYKAKVEVFEHQDNIYWN